MWYGQPECVPQAMTEASELKDRMEKERHKLETKLRQQCECQQERACDLEREVGLLTL